MFSFCANIFHIYKYTFKYIYIRLTIYSWRFDLKLPFSDKYVYKKRSQEKKDPPIIWAAAKKVDMENFFKEMG